MKNKLQFFLASTIVFTLTCLMAVPAVASGREIDFDFVRDGLYYKKLDVSVDGKTRLAVAKGYGYDDATEIVIPDTFTYDNVEYRVCGIHSEAFSGSKNLTSVNIGNSVTYIGENAFSNCANLTSVNIGNSVTYVGEKAFFFCYNLASVNIGNSVTEIGESAFAACFFSLKSITIPGNVEKIGDYAFEGCDSLANVTLEDNVDQLALKVGREVFEGCDLISEVYVGRNITNENHVYEYIDDYTPFYGKYSLRKVTIGNYVTEISRSAFAACHRLKSVDIGDSVIEIGWDAFQECSSLTSVNMGNSVTTIGSGAFDNCSKLTSISHPNSVTEIGSSAFYGCGLTSVNLGNSVTEIGWSAFQYCDKLTSITIPSSVTKIREYAFKNDSSLVSITSLSTTPPSADEATFFYYTYSRATLYVPIGTADLYRTADCWKNFASIEEFDPAGIKDIPADADGAVVIYDLQGHRLAKPQRGLNIINGKKVLMK